MAAHGTMSASDGERLRQEWMQHSARAFEQMFAQEQQAGLITFTQREDRAVELGQALAKWLVEEHVAGDAAAQPSEHPGACAACCPKCGKAGVLVTQRQDPLADRELVSRAGTVRLERERYRCTTCRVVFFPLGPEAGTERRGVQPAGSGEAGSPGRQVGELRRRLR